MSIISLKLIGSECEIRTHGPFTVVGFQDQCIKPLCQLAKTKVLKGELKYFEEPISSSKRDRILVIVKQLSYPII